MLAEQFTVAAGAARRVTQLDEIARLLWRGHAEGHFDEIAAQAISEAIEARRATLRAPRVSIALSQLKAPTAHRRPVTPDKARSLARRRGLAASGAVPGRIAAAFTTGEAAALSVVAREAQRRGHCSLPIDAIAAIAGTCRTVVQGALRHARRIGLIAVTERPRPGQKSDTNLVTISSPEWQAWLRLGGDRVRKKKHHEYRLSNCVVQVVTNSRRHLAFLRPFQPFPDHGNGELHWTTSKPSPSPT